MSDFSARRLSQNFGAKLKQKSAQVCAVFSWKFWAIPPVRLGLSGRNSGKNSGKTPETLSERFLEFPSRVRLGCPKPYNSRHLRLPECFQNSLPPQYGWGRLFFQNWFRRGPLRAGHGILSSTGGISEICWHRIVTCSVTVCGVLVVLNLRGVRRGLCGGLSEDSGVLRGSTGFSEVFRGQ